MFRRFLPKRKRDVVRVHGMTLRLNPRDSTISPELRAGHDWEPSETVFLEAFVRPGDVVADVGANLGWFTLLLGKRVGRRGRVLAFEPDPLNCELLRENVRRNHLRRIVAVVPAAVGAENGTATLYRYLDGNYGDQRTYSPPGTDGVREALQVPLVTLDSLTENLPPLRLLKIDIQGFEARALPGMARTLQRDPRPVVVCEFWPQGLAAAGSDPGIFLAEIERGGYMIFELCAPEMRVQPATPEALLQRYTVANGEFTNVIAVPATGEPWRTMLSAIGDIEHFAVALRSL